MNAQKMLIAMNVVLISIILIGWSSGLQKQDFSEIRIKDKNGKTRIELKVDEKGNPQILCYGADGGVSHSIGVGDHDVAYIALPYITLQGDNVILSSPIGIGGMGIYSSGIRLEKGDTDELDTDHPFQIIQGERNIYSLNWTKSGLIRETFYDHAGRNRLQLGFDAQEAPSILLSDERGNVNKQMY